VPQQGRRKASSWNSKLHPPMLGFLAQGAGDTRMARAAFGPGDDNFGKSTMSKKGRNKSEKKRQDRISPFKALIGL
jgi:hypothetical protein